MLERSLLSVLLAAALWWFLEPDDEHGPARTTATALLLGALSWTVLAWTKREMRFADSFPPELTPFEILSFVAAGLALGPAAFAAAGGRGDARRGLAFGATTAAIGLCASRWAQMARGLELDGHAFAGPFVTATLGAAVAATAAAAAAALTAPDLRPLARRLLVALFAAWAVPTAVAGTVLRVWWGFGPRSLAEAAGIPTNADSQVVSIVRLSPSRNRSYTREASRMAARGVDLSPESLTKLQLFLRSSGFRDVFARDALKAVRMGWLSWWETESALDAMMIAVPGRVHPDYRGALDLIKAGPLTPERYAKLEKLAEAAAASSEGFEDGETSQIIFEDFAACYARFGDDAKARQWIQRTFNLFGVSEKSLEITPVEDFRAGSVSGSVLEDGRPPESLLVGLFMVWKSTPSAAGRVLLSQSAFVDRDGRFEFDDLGPGEYELGLLGKPSDLNGLISAVPERFRVDEEHPIVAVPTILIERELKAVPAFAPGGLPEPPTPEVPERPLMPLKR